MKNAGFLLCFLVCVSMYFSVVTAQVASPREQRTKYVTDPQRNPMTKLCARKSSDWYAI